MYKDTQLKEHSPPKNRKFSPTPKLITYNRHNYQNIPQLQKLSEQEVFEIEVVSKVLPFKTNNYVIEKLINWDNYREDPIFILNFPNRQMLLPHHYDILSKAIIHKKSQSEIDDIVFKIRQELNPHPAGQLELNVPKFDGEKFWGLQHKYKETVLIFPRQGQTCHAYCTFCFRWPQFTDYHNLKFYTKDIDRIIKYLKYHPEVTDILFTGGDPMIMSAKILGEYIYPILNSNFPNIKSIRIGSKVLSYWPYRFITDEDSQKLLQIFKDVKNAGKNLAFMAHFSHNKEMETKAVKKAIQNLVKVGATIRTQSPILRHINDSPLVWKKMWEEQVRMQCVPYYMFIPRDTGSQHYFSVPLVRAYSIFKNAYKQVSGLARTVRGPIMSCTYGKISIVGIGKVHNSNVFILKMIQGRNPNWVNHPFFAELNPSAIWISDLKPAFGARKFFFEK